MADFVQKSVTKSSDRTLTTKWDTIVNFGTMIQSIITNQAGHNTSWHRLSYSPWNTFAPESLTPTGHIQPDFSLLRFLTCKAGRQRVVNLSILSGDGLKSLQWIKLITPKILSSFCPANNHLRGFTH
jgi:hypothetical protein